MLHPSSYQERQASAEPFIDLVPLATLAMAEAGFATDYPPQSAQEAKEAPAKAEKTLKESDAVDLRHLLWSSIDNPDSMDLDQIEFAERREDGSIRVMVGIADVDSFVPIGSATDQHAAFNTTSVYTGVKTFPMLPPAFSEDISSLLPGEDHLAMVVDMVIDSEGNVPVRHIYPALVRNYAKLNYEAVGEWLEHQNEFVELDTVEGLEAQIRLQYEASEHLLRQRQRSGTLDLETIEARPVVSDGEILDLKVTTKNPARYIIENFMIAANNAVADFLREQGVTSIQRVVKTPERWGRIVDLAETYDYFLPSEPNSRALAEFLKERQEIDPLRFPDLSLTVVKLLGQGEYTVLYEGQLPEGHFGLAIMGYTHSTAPNRRFPDLVTQRILKAVNKGQVSPYGDDELYSIARHCTERSAAARKVERRMRKAAAALLLRHRVGEEFEALVTGASNKGTYARLLNPPAEGRVIQGFHGLDVGDKIKVRLLAADPITTYIDFAVTRQEEKIEHGRRRRRGRR